MPIINSSESENDAILQAAKLMMVSARTAPKSGGVDDVSTAILLGEEKDRLVEEMEKIAEARNNEGFRRDARNTRDSSAVLLVGILGTKKFGLDCGACGYPTCSEFDAAIKRSGQDFTGPNCIFKILDAGIALGSAAKTASLLNIDNRIMYRIGTAAKRLNMLPEASVIMGIPLSAKGKSIYFDRQK